MKITYTILVVAIIALVGLAIGWNLKPVEIPVGSVQSGSEYHATTTYSGVPQLQYLVTGVGTLGSLVVTKAGAATLLNTLYDATTTNANLRAASMATTSIIIAVWPGNMAAGTYTFDTVFYNGLLLDLASGTGVGSTTITFKP